MSASEKSHWRFSLAALLLGVSGVAVVCVVLPYPYVAFYSLLTLFFLAAIVARFGPSYATRLWFWFSLWGWTYILLGSSLGELVESSAQWTYLREWLVEHKPVPLHWTPEHYFQLGHFTLAASVAFAGASLSTFIVARRDSKALDQVRA